MRQIFRIDNSRGGQAAIILILLVAWLLRIYDLNARSLWFDEGMEYWVATSTVRDLPQNVRVGIQDPPLYSFLLHFWMVLGQNEFYLRFMSVIFSFLSVVGTIVLTRRLSGLLTGLIAGSVMAVLPSQIRYAQEVGQYALMVCLLIWCLVALQEVLNKEQARYLAVWAMLAITATYSYYGAVFMLIIPACIVTTDFLINREWKKLRNILVALSVYLIGIVPLIVYFLPKQLFRGPTTDAFRFALNSPVEELRALWISTLQLIAFQFTGWPWTHIPLWLPSFIVILLLLLALIHTEKTQKRILIWLFATWAVYYIIGKLGLFPYGYRYGLILTPLLIPIISHGISNALGMKRYYRVMGMAAFLGIMVICIISLPNRTFRDNLHQDADWAWPETQDLQPIVKYWLENDNESDPTYIYSGAAPVFAYYMDLVGLDTLDRPPDWYTHCWRGEAPDYCHANELYYGEWMRKFDQAQKIASVRNTLPANSEKIWLVFSHIYHEEDSDILAGLQEDYLVVQSYEKDNASVYLLHAK